MMKFKGKKEATQPQYILTNPIYKILPVEKMMKEHDIFDKIKLEPHIYVSL